MSSMDQECDNELLKTLIHAAQTNIPQLPWIHEVYFEKHKLILFHNWFIFNQWFIYFSLEIHIKYRNVYGVQSVLYLIHLRLFPMSLLLWMNMSRNVA